MPGPSCSLSISVMRLTHFCDAQPAQPAQLARPASPAAAEAGPAEGPAELCRKYPYVIVTPVELPVHGAAFVIPGLLSGPAVMPFAPAPIG